MRTLNRQMSEDWRAVDVSVSDYTSEITGKFIVRVGGSGDIVLRNTVTDTPITIQALDGERIEFPTDTVYQTGTTATNIQAIY